MPSPAGKDRRHLASATASQAGHQVPSPTTCHLSPCYPAGRHPPFTDKETGAQRGYVSGSRSPSCSAMMELVAQPGRPELQEGRGGKRQVDADGRGLLFSRCGLPGASRQRCPACSWRWGLSAQERPGLGPGNPCSGPGRCRRSLQTQIFMPLKKRRCLLSFKVTLRICAICWKVPGSHLICFSSLKQM